MYHYNSAILFVPLMAVIFMDSSTQHTAAAYSSRIIHIHARIGNDSEECLKGQEVNQYYKSIEFIADKLSNSSTRNVTIVLASPIILRSQIVFKNYDFFALQGISDSTKLKCKCSKRGAGVSLLFTQINNLVLFCSSIQNCCGARDANFAAISVQECLNIDIERFRINNNDYSSGLVLMNPHGNVSIKNCQFEQNGRRRLLNDSPFAGGFHIQVSQPVIISTTVTIESCKFIHNEAPKISRYEPSAIDTSNRKWEGKSFGGGLGIAILKKSNASKIYIVNCEFIENFAKWGGGLCVYVQQQTYDNRVFVSDSTFVGNKAEDGGGGLAIRLDLVDRSHIHFQNVTFERNHAGYGGGMSISALFGNSVTEPGEILMFTNCTWYANSGHYSPAIDISPYSFQRPSQGYVPIPLFKDIDIKRNYAFAKIYHQVTWGVFTITRFSVHFQGHIIFEDNQCSALYLTSGRAVINENSTVVFRSNQGIKGGAVAIHGFSAIVVNDHSYFEFMNNSAARLGGGIYTMLQLTKGNTSVDKLAFWSMVVMITM